MAAKRRKSKKAKRGLYKSTKTGQLCTYRSSWELAYFNYLDNDPDVIWWGSETLTISYVSNYRTGKLRKYIPDFIIKRSDGQTYVEEIKPTKRLTNLLVQKKHNMADVWCRENGYIFKVITEVELKQLKLL